MAGQVIMKSSAGVFAPAWACELNRQREIAFWWKGRTPERMTSQPQCQGREGKHDWHNDNLRYMKGGQS